MDAQTTDAFVEALERVVEEAVNRSREAHDGQVDPADVARYVAGQLWARTLPGNHPDTGAWVRHLRGSLGLTQAELADRLGCHQITVARWETGGQAPRGKKLRALQELARKFETSRCPQCGYKLNSVPGTS